MAVAAVILVTQSILFSRPLFAQTPSQLSQLADGSSSAEVIAALGEPTERVEKEAKRDEIWRYPNAIVRFHEGVVVAVTNKSGEPQNVPPTPAAHVSERAKTGGKQVEELISEILREVPTDNSPAGPGNPSGNPPPPPPIEAVQ